MKSKEILTIFAFIFLGLCLLLNLGNKSSLQKWGDASMFIAIVLLAVAQLLGETEKFAWEVGVVNSQGEGQNYKEVGRCTTGSCPSPKKCDTSTGYCVTTTNCIDHGLKPVYKPAGTNNTCTPADSPVPGMPETWPCKCTKNSQCKVLGDNLNCEGH